LSKIVGRLDADPWIFASGIGFGVERASRLVKKRITPSLQSARSKNSAALFRAAPFYHPSEASQGTAQNILPPRFPELGLPQPY
jgi:hypothetical protein